MGVENQVWKGPRMRGLGGRMHARNRPRKDLQLWLQSLFSSPIPSSSICGSKAEAEAPPTPLLGLLVTPPSPQLLAPWFYLSQERCFLLSFFLGPDLFLTTSLLTSLINPTLLVLLLFAYSSFSPFLADLFLHFPLT